MASSISEKTSLLSSRSRKELKVKPLLVIHGGAGTMSREGSTPERQEQYRSVLRQALLTGHEVLRTGCEAMDAAVAAVGVMEGVPWPYISTKPILTALSQIALFLTPARAPYSMPPGKCVLRSFVHLCYGLILV